MMKGTCTMSKEKKANYTQEKANAVDDTSVEVLSGEVIISPFSEADEQKYNALCAKLGTFTDEIEEQHIVVACTLATIYDEKLYRVENYGNIYDFAEEKYKMSRGYCNNHINICKKFCQYDEQSHTYTELLPAYKEFTISQLANMLSIPEGLLEKITPNMKVADIKRFKKMYMSPASQLEEKESVPPSGKKKPEKRAELLRANNISELSDINHDLLQKKIMEFEEENPDIPYTFSISIIYDTE